MIYYIAFCGVGRVDWGVDNMPVTSRELSLGASFRVSLDR